VIPNFLQAALKGFPAQVFGDGKQTRDFIYVENVVDANVLAGTLPADRVNGWVCNVGEGRRTSLLDLVTVIASVIGRQFGYVPQPARDGDVRDSLACMERARRVLGFEARVSLEEGLRHTWNWLSGYEPEMIDTAAPDVLTATILDAAPSPVPVQVPTLLTQPVLNA
jgi:nucleoside-diphosphate-sugar epimerase